MQLHSLPTLISRKNGLDLKAGVHRKRNTIILSKAELLQLNRTQFPSLEIFVSKKVKNRKN